MKWLILFMLLPFCAFAQKQDYIRTPNGPNTIVDWNVKFKTLIVPHGGLLTLAGSQDSTGHLYLLVTPSDTSLYFYVRGKGWLLNRTSVTRSSVIAALGYTPLASEVDPLVPNYAKSLTAFSIIKSSTDILYQPIGSYLTTEIDPNVPAYSKSLSAFSIIKGSTDALYQAIGSYYTQSQVNTLLAGKQATLTTGTTTQYLRGDLSLAIFPTAISAFTNDAGYLTGAHVTSFNTRTGTVAPLIGDYSAFYYPLSGNPSAFLTAETDPTVPAYSKSLSAFSVVKTSTDALYYPIPTGTTGQYIRGNGTLATFPTGVSSFSNDAGYLTNATGDVRYPQLSGGYVNPSWITSLPYTKITGAPTFNTLSNGFGIASLSYTTVANASVIVDTTAIKSKASALTDYNNVVIALSNKQPLENQRVSTSNSPTFANVTTPGTYTGQLAFSHIAGYGLSGSNFTNLASQTWTADTISFTGIVSKGRATANYVQMWGSAQTINHPVTIVSNTAPQMIVGGAQAATADLTISAAGAQVKELQFATSNSSRMIVRVNSNSESGSNAGSDFEIDTRSDLGAFIKAALYIKRSSGNVLVNKTTDATGTLQVNGRIWLSQGLVGTAHTDSILVHDNTSKEIKLIAPNALTDGLIGNILSKTADYTIIAGDFASGKRTLLDLYVDATAGAVIITLPSSSTFSGYEIYVTKTDVSVNTVTINTVSGLNLLTTQYQSRHFMSNGSAWFNH